MASKAIKLVMLGGCGVGKSCITIRFVQDRFETDYTPSIENSFQRTLAVDGTNHLLEILDTAGTEQFVTMRELYIRTGQGFVLVYAINLKPSFLALTDIINQIKTQKPKDEDRHLMIIGNKCDMEDRVIPTADGDALAKANSARFFETSARTKHNVVEAFTQIVRDILAHSTPKKKKFCNIL
ncbi:GTP binding [Pelomyxa schiedti]|nr:GTP binding [Pelomyxa schiedti]